MTNAPEVRLNSDGGLDEIVATGASVHLEQMGANRWWMSIESGGKRVDVWLESSRKIKANFEVGND